MTTICRSVQAGFVRPERPARSRSWHRRSRRPRGPVASTAVAHDRRRSGARSGAVARQASVPDASSVVMPASVTVKARVVRHRPGNASLTSHLIYLRRDGVTRDGAPGRMFDATGDAVDANAFSERCGGDRHHFRFIVAPEDAAELSDLRTYTRDLMATAQIRPRHHARLGRGRSLEHRASARPRSRAWPRR